MKAWYLDHSGFAVETGEYFLIFDYYRDEPKGGGLADGVIDPAALRGKRVVAFVSHGHHDHFNRAIFGWQRALPDIRYVLSEGVRPDGGDAIRLGPGQSAELGELRVRTLPSTDEGVAFLVRRGEDCVYHAGDLNWWHWNGESADYNREMAQNYAAYLKPLEGERIDLAFVPVDPRLEDKYFWGLDYFMRTVGAARVAPMHFWGDESVFSRLRENPRTAGYRERILGPFRRGEQLLPLSSGGG